MNITCEHCESEIDVEKDPRCVVYRPSGATDVMCEACRKLILGRRQEAPFDRVALGPHPDKPEGKE